MKWGILATGNIAGKFASTIRQMEGEGQTLAAVGSRRAESAAAFAGRYGIPRAHGSYEALAADPSVEAVYVATPNSLHDPNVRLCLENGKHVLCEKPFTLTAAQARELYALADAKGLFLMEALWTRFLPLYGRLRELLAEGGHRPGGAGQLPVRLRSPGGAPGTEVPLRAGRGRFAGHRGVQPGLFADDAGRARRGGD